MTVRDQINHVLLATGRRVGRRLPASAQQVVVAAGSRLALRLGGDGVERARHNLSVAAGRPIGNRELRAALASYLRMMLEVWALPSWSAERAVSTVRVVGEDALREAARTSGAVVALAHSGNWDLAAAWANSTGLPVTTVAERLVSPEWEAFVALRQRWGSEVWAHTESGLLPRLVRAIGRGRVVCLLAEREIPVHTGIPAIWSGHPIRVPAGPAMVAQLSGAALLPAVCHYTGSVGTGGMVITIGPPVPHRSGRDGMAAMTQDVIDFFADQVPLRVHDWHLFQPFFDVSDDR